MAREVDPRRTRKARRLIERLKAAGETAAERYSGWEEEFLAEVDQRLDRYGSAFHDLSKGAGEDAISRLQAQKLKEIAAKAKGKKPGGFKQRQPSKKGSWNARKREAT